MVPLTAQAHARLRWHLVAGDVVIDATAGNGHDTLFLSQQVGPGGHVFAIDIQPAALDSARRRLDAAGGASNVSLILGDHARLPDLIPVRHRGSISVVMFNLGYLPGGDKSLITRRSTTVKALDAAFRMLRPGGLLTVLAYPGHPGGAQELAGVLEWRNGLCPVGSSDSNWTRKDEPRLMVIRKSDG